jgi:hypothetical protein
MAVPSLDEVLGSRSRVEVSPEHYTAALFAPIAEELLEQIEVLESQGAVYARAYLEYLRAGGQGYGPRAPLGMNPQVAKAVRDVVTDHVLHARFTLGRAS